MKVTRFFGIPFLVALLALALAAPVQAAISAKSIGERFACTAGASITAGQLIALKNADGKCYPADRTDSTIRPALGWAVSAYSSGASMQVVTRGILTGFTSLTIGSPVYLTTAGGYSQSAPTAYGQAVGRALTATDVQIAITDPNVVNDAAVTSGKLTTTMATGFIPLSLADGRGVLTDYPNKSASPPGGLLMKDSTPILERTNSATDISTRLNWAASNVSEVQWSFPYPPDWDNTQNASVCVLAQMSGATDTPTLTWKYFPSVGGTDQGGATAALSSTTAKQCRTITAAGLGAYPSFASISVTPGAHGTNAVYMYAAWIEYTRK